MSKYEVDVTVPPVLDFELPKRVNAENRKAHNFHIQGQAMDLAMYQFPEYFRGHYADQLEAAFESLKVGVGRVGRSLNMLTYYAKLIGYAVDDMKEGDYKTALVNLDTAMALALYKMRMPLAWVAPIQRLRLSCFRRIRENEQNKSCEVSG